MTQAARTEETIARLRFAVKERLLTGDFALVGKTVLEHLSKPKQITAIGRSGAGKTSLLNMLIGKAQMPDVSHIPIVELTFGAESRHRIEAGSTHPETRNGIVSPGDLPADTVRLVQELPDPAFADRSFAEVNIPQDGAALHHVFDWLVETTDIALWCTQGFDDREAAFWARMPDGLKDNSFLVLTKADQLQMKGKLSQQTTEFENRHADEFLCLYPVATKQAMAARAADGDKNTALWSASGGKALCDGLLDQMESGRRGDLDYAEMLLAQVADKLPRSIPAETPQRPASSKTAAPAPAKTREGLSPMNRAEALETALRILQDCAEDMNRARGGGDAHEAEAVLTHSAEAAQALATLLMDVGEEDGQLTALRDDVQQSEQMILLLQLEGTDSAASDAVTALLQLKKEVAEVAFA
ncbi:MAG: hypothetical protein AAGF27_08385 [Pseudomonadota bacterium]